MKGYDAWLDRQNPHTNPPELKPYQKELLVRELENAVNDLQEEYEFYLDTEEEIGKEEFNDKLDKICEKYYYIGVSDMTVSTIKSDNRMR